MSAQKNYLVTGANRGLGLEFTKQILQAGHNVYATCRNTNDIDDLNEYSGKYKDSLIILKLDINDHDSILKLNKKLRNVSIDVMINLFGPVKMAETFLDQIEKGQDKKMVFISSVVGSIADDHQKAFAYATSKTALNKSVALMADILKERKVKVLAMCPGYVKTRMNGGGANLEPEESIKGMLKQIEKLDLESSGSFVRYNGESINW